MQIEILSLSSAGEDELFVSVELREGEKCEKRRLLVPSSVYVDMRLRKGECTPEVFDALEYESNVYAAYKRGVCIVGFGACSERMLTSKLIAKGFEKDIAREAVGRIAERGFISEKDNAVREAERAFAKLWGASRIRAHLISKGYASDAVDCALFALEDAGLDFGENCRRLIESKYKKVPKDRNELQKLIASVCRYGYSLGEVKAACAEIASRKISIYD